MFINPLEGVGGKVKKMRIDFSREDPESLTRYRYGFNIRVDSYINPEAIERESSRGPNYAGVRGIYRDTQDLIRNRVLLYLNQYNLVRPRESRVARIMGISSSDVYVWIQDEDTLARIRDDLTRIVSEEVGSSTANLVSELREVSWED